LRNQIIAQDNTLTNATCRNQELESLVQSRNNDLNKIKKELERLKKNDIQRTEGIIPYDNFTKYVCYKSNGTWSYCEFSDFVIESGSYMIFDKKYNMDRKIGVFTKNGKFIIFDEKLLDNVKLITLLKNEGFTFKIKMSKNNIVKVLSDYITETLNENKQTIYIPYYNGWNEKGKFIFPEFNDKNGLISPYYRSKFITSETNEPVHSITTGLSVLNSLHDKRYSVVMIGILLSGLLYTRLQKTGFALNQAIVLNCDSPANSFVDIFLKIYNKGENNISLKTPNKNIKNAVDSSKDELLIVDGRVNNTNEYLIKTNLNFLIDIFVNQIQADDNFITNKSTLVLLSQNLEFMIEKEKFLFIDLKDNIDVIPNFSNFYKYMGDIIKYFVKYAENIRLTAEDFTKYKIPDSIQPIYRRTYVIFMRLLDIFKDFLQTYNIDINKFLGNIHYEKLLQEFFVEEKNFDEEGIEEMVCEILKMNIIKNKTLVIYDKRLSINDTIVDNKLFSDNSTIFFSEIYMKKNIMPFMKIDMSLEKVLKALHCTDILVKRKDGYRCKRTIFINGEPKQFGFIVLKNKNIIDCKNYKKTSIKEADDYERFAAWCELQ